MQKQKERIVNFFRNKAVIVAASVLFLSLLMPDIANASTLNQASVVLGRLGIGASTNNTMLVTFKLKSTPTSVAKILVTMTGFTVTTGTPTIGNSFPNTPSGITLPPGLTAGTSTATATAAGTTILVSGLTSASLNNTTLYGFTLPSGTITNPATAGSYPITVASENSSGTPIDTTTVPEAIYGTSANQDQVVVTASVSPSFTFNLTSNTDTISSVSPSATAVSTGVYMNVGTNSPLGYTAYVASKNNALTSATNPSTPISGGAYTGTAPNTMTPGTTSYGFAPSTGAACSSCTGTLSYDPEYAGLTANQSGGFNGTNTLSSFVERSGYTNDDQILLQEKADVASSVGYSSDYTDTLTIVAAGNF